MALADVQQKNVTAAEAAAADALNPLTGQFLEPVDGKGICADNFATGKSPVNPALTQLKKLIAGLRGSLRGDFAGAVQKSIKSILVDTSGGTTHTQLPGTIRIAGTGVTANDVLVVDQGGILNQNGYIKTTGIVGDFIAVLGKFFGLNADSYLQLGDAGIEISFHTTRYLAFGRVTTGVGGSNPPQGTPTPNQLRAVHIPKGLCCVRMSAPNTITSFDGGGVSGVAITAGSFIFTFASPFTDTNYTVLTGTLINTASGFAIPQEFVSFRSTTQCQIIFSTAVGVAINPALVAIDGFSIGFFGKQTT